MAKTTIKRTFNLFFLILFLYYNVIDGTHFRGGIISWRPLNATPSGSSAQILVHQRYFWWRNYSGFGGYLCTEADVASGTLIMTNAYMKCLKNCTSSNYPTTGLSTNMITSDCQSNALIESWAGEKYDLLSLNLTTSITIGFNSSAWLHNLYIGADSDWSIVNRLNLGLRPDGYINTSPVTNTLPVIFYPISTLIAHRVEMADNDATDILLCRWSNTNSGTNYNAVDECGGVCYGLPPGYGLISSNCTVTFTLPTANKYYAVALQIEDYYNSAATVPMSSVPIQFLFFGYIPASPCAHPNITGVRPNRACIGVPYNVQLNETIIVQTYCPGQSVVDFITASPYGMTHSTISHPSTFTWVMTLTWTPQVVQAGPQTFCAAALDNNNLQSDPWCITYLVGYDSPNITRPLVVQGSASPVGTVFQNQSMFFIQATGEVGRPNRNGTNVCFRNSATGIAVVCYDAGYAPNVVYTANTIVIITNVTWTPGQFYYVTMDSGFVSGSVFCHAESAPITDPTYWVFNIWDPAVSSTTTTTTTPFSTATVTTVPTSTTSINTLLTTTGIVITTTTPATTTAALTTTSTLTTSTAVATTSVTTSDSVVVINPQDLEQLCHHPILIMNLVMMVAFMPIYALVMYGGFTKFSSMFNPVHIKAKERHNLRMRRILSR